MKLRSSPFTETAIEGVHSVVYKPGVEAVPFSGDDGEAGPLGTFARGVQRVSGVVFSHDGSAAETLLSLTDEIDLMVRYRASGQKRTRTLSNIIFVGDATVTIPSLNNGRSPLIGVPFRLPIASGETLAEHIIDAVES